MSSFGVNSSIDSVASGYFMTEFKKRVFLFTLFYCICQEKVDTNKNETQNPDSVLN